MVFVANEIRREGFSMPETWITQEAPQEFTTADPVVCKTHYHKLRLIRSDQSKGMMSMK